MSKFLNTKTSELEISVQANSDAWKAEIAKAEELLIKKVEVKGFRKGNVPANIAKQHISDADVFSEAIKVILDVLVAEANKEIDGELVLDRPAYLINNIDRENLDVKFIYPVYPTFEIADYKNLDIEFKAEEVNDELINSELGKIQDAKKEVVSKEDKTIEAGNIAVFDFEGFVDGEAFEGGKAENFELLIGSGQFIPGFEDGMIGLKAGDEKDLEVTFPEDYQAPNLKGKASIFKIKIHDVKEEKLPELNDELAKSVGAKDVETLDQLKAYIKEVFTEQYNQQARSQFQRAAFDKILEGTEIAVPGSLIIAEMKKVRATFEENVKKQGVDLAQYKQLTGMDDAALNSQFKAQAESRLKDSFIFAEIAKLENIEITDADYDAEYEKLAKVYGQSADSVKGVITKAQMQIPMTNDKVLDVLIDNAK